MTLATPRPAASSSTSVAAGERVASWQQIAVIGQVFSRVVVVQMQAAPDAVAEPVEILGTLFVGNCPGRRPSARECQAPSRAARGVPATRSGSSVIILTAGATRNVGLSGKSDR